MSRVYRKGKKRMEKFCFTCMTCNEKFNVEFKHMLKKDALVCPNCSNTLPDDVFQHLKTIATSIKAYESSWVDNLMEKSNHFDMTIQ